MRIWVLTHEYPPHIIGGLGTVATALTHQLATQKELEVFVLTTGKKYNVSFAKKITIITLPPTSLKEPKEILRYLTSLRIPMPHLIHVHSVQYTLFANTLRKKIQVPLLYTCHSLVVMEKGKTRKTVELQQVHLLKRASKVVVPSLWLKRKIREYYPQFSAKVTVIENGMDLVKQEPLVSPFRLAFIGRLVRLKGIRELIEAVAQLSIIHPTVTLDIYGNGKKAFIKNLKKLVTSNGLDTKVHWHGFIKPDELKKILPTLGAVVVPSKQESFGMVALEALGSGVPLISTRSGGLADFVDDEVAEIINQVDPISIANAIEQMWGQQEKTHHRIKKGYELAGKYSWDAIGLRYRLVMERVMRRA